ncbi:MAG: pyruvate, water dikinase regulatory protein [Pseudomonadota bacterium]
MPATAPTLHIISDSTGETGYAIAKAALARFDITAPVLSVSVFVRSDADLDAAVTRLREQPGCVFYTLASAEHRARLMAEIARLDIPAISVLEGAIDTLSDFLGRPPLNEPGRQHRVNDAYFERISALDFAMANDDGALGPRLKSADVILTGVSRTSKTPTCIYLAYRGIRAANLPLVPGRSVPPAFMEAMASGVPVVGLVASPGRLSHVRGQRLEILGDRGLDYADLERIQAELAEARLFFERHAIPVIDVTRRSIEETAASVVAIMEETRRKAGERR